MEKLREARNPNETYGKRVNRRLRGRWFSLVPVRRRSLGLVTGVVGGFVILLVFAHHSCVTSSWFANHPNVARPLRLDRPDSFGHWILCVLLAASAGISFLIYQLRRHRSDDFRGHYRLWRLLTFVLVAASLHSLVGLVGWLGAILDSFVGKRVALTGSDWLRLMLLFGSAILALRVVAEVRKSRWALLFVLLGISILAVPEAVNWNLIEVETIGRWSLVTSAPLLGCTALFVGFVGYLRMVFRDVRKIEDTETFAEKFAKLKEQVLGRSDYDDYEAEPEPEPEPKERRGWFSRRARKSEREEQQYDDQEDELEEEDYEEDEPESEVAEEQEVQGEPEPRNTKRKRGWLGRRKRAAAEPAQDEADEQEEEALADDETADEKPKRKKRGWSFRLKPKAEPEDSEEPAVNESEDEASTDDDAEEPAPAKKRGPIFGWRKKNAAGNSDDEVPEESEPEPEVQEQVAESSDEEIVDANDIDWSSLSKSERRRLRKKLKRQNRAA